MNPSFRFAQCWRKYSSLIFKKKKKKREEAKPQSNNTPLQVHFYIKFSRNNLLLLSVKDFDTGLLKKNTVKVLHITHASSLGSTKLSSIGIMDSFWKMHFFILHQSWAKYP